MKITVLGAGAIGSAVAYDLCRHDEVTCVQVCEARPGTLRAFRQTQTHPKLRTYLADARDAQTLEPILTGSVCVVSCVAPELNVGLARQAVEMGAHFVDLGSPETIREEEESLAALAERRQRWVVTGSGLAPALQAFLYCAASRRWMKPMRAMSAWGMCLPTRWNRLTTASPTPPRN